MATRAPKPKRAPKPPPAPGPVELLTAERASLHSRIDELQAEFDAVVVNTDSHPARDTDSSDAGSIDVDRDRVTGLLGAVHERLVQVEAALRRAEAGTWGVCAACERPISEERLAALPSATTCIECASPRLRNRIGR